MTLGAILDKIDRVKTCKIRAGWLEEGKGGLPGEDVFFSGYVSISKREARLVARSAYEKGLLGRIRYAFQEDYTVLYIN